MADANSAKPASDFGIIPEALARIAQLAGSPSSDSLFDQQWHFQNAGQSGGTPGIDINVAPVWDD